MQLLFTYSLAKPRNDSSGVIIHRLVLRWAKERLNETMTVQAARDTVLAVARYNQGNMSFFEGRWITRDYNQKFLDWNTRCWQLIDDHLREEVRQSSDWELLLAVERLATDFFYSAKADQTNSLIQALMENPKMTERAYGMALAVIFYQREGVFPYAQQFNISFKHVPSRFQSKEMSELQLLWDVAVDWKPFDEKAWEAFFAERKESELHADVAVARMLLNITRLETMINTPFYHPNQGQQRRGEIVKIRDIGQELSQQLQNLYSSKVTPPFKCKTPLYC
jgi:hypothetical protein